MKNSPDLSTDGGQHSVYIVKPIILTGEAPIFAMAAEGNFQETRDYGNQYSSTQKILEMFIIYLGVLMAGNLMENHTGLNLKWYISTDIETSSRVTIRKGEKEQTK